MGSSQTILFIGDQTDAWIDGIDYITHQATRTPWLKTFMRDLCHTMKAELKDMEPAVTESLGNFQSLPELADRYRTVADETGVANALLIHAVRAALLLQYVPLSLSLHMVLTGTRKRPSLFDLGSSQLPSYKQRKNKK